MKVASGNVLWRQRKRNWCRTPFTFTVYMLTDQEMSIKTGILNEKFNLIKLFRIVDISVERTFLQRLFGLSTLVLDTRDQSSGNGVVVLKNVVHGFEVRRVMQEAVDSSRKENGMSAREFLGGPGGPGPEGPGMGFDAPDLSWFFWLEPSAFLFLESTAAAVWESLYVLWGAHTTSSGAVSTCWRRCRRS